MSANSGLNRIGIVFKALAIGWLMLWVSVWLYTYLSGTNEEGTFIVAVAIASIPAAVAWVIGWVIQGFAD